MYCVTWGTEEVQHAVLLLPGRLKRSSILSYKSSILLSYLFSRKTKEIQQVVLKEIRCTVLPVLQED